MAKHSAIYLRVSSKQQNHASQLPDLERWVQAHGGPVIWYRDKFTGKTMDRPGMESLIADLRAGKIEADCGLEIGPPRSNHPWSMPIIR